MKVGYVRAEKIYERFGAVCYEEVINVTIAISPLPMHHAASNWHGAKLVFGMRRRIYRSGNGNNARLLPALTLENGCSYSCNMNLT